ncbi:AAA family ATPase [Pseudoprevotella muciniphila]|uniref:AAA family ATPase n=1 Tax=Pseudoprevotella muciniphila TaxID=2133944 RepID=A0A5P8E7I4_9BACT|nr:AAA family ATPase [Pseudoprevotella muciniphila]QFQ13009.1 AAA family ATPase [Pseudoprevotella muciniphila]
MEKLFERHDIYLSEVPMGYVRDFMHLIHWDSRLVIVKGPKGVGKSTLLLQYIKKNFEPDDRHVLYCSADTGYFATHTIVDLADKFVKRGGQWLFLDEVHKYEGWSREIKEIYDLYPKLHIVLSGSSLIQINDGQADLSRRMLRYDMPGLSFREFLKFDKGIDIEAVTLGTLLESPNMFCSHVRSLCHPLEHFGRYLQYGYYPFYFENKRAYYRHIEDVVNYIIDVELTKHRNIEVGNTRSLKALLQVISQMTPYEVDIAKLSKATGISRPSTLKYLTHMEEACLIHRLFTDLKRVTDLQKPDKIYLDNSNLLYALCPQRPEIGTVREAFFANQLVSAGHTVEYAGYKKGDFCIDGNTVIEVGGADKGFSQLAGNNLSFVAADDIESASMRKIPLWAFGFLY